MRRLLVVLLAVATISAGCGPAADSGTTPMGSTSSTGLSPTLEPESPDSSSSRPETSTTQPAADDGVFLPGGAVPWEKVDEDWLLAMKTRQDRKALTIVGPDGSGYEMASWPAEWLLDRTIVDWSPDRREALVLLPAYEPAMASELWLVDLETAEWQLVDSLRWSALSDLWGGFTRPTGANLVVMIETDAGVRLERRSRSGELLATLATRPSGPVSWLYGVDGTTVLVADGTDISLLSNSGDRIRTLLSSPTECSADDEFGTIRSCELEHWWSPDTAVVSCRVRSCYAGSSDWVELWQIPVDGTEPARFETAGASVCDDGPQGSAEAMWPTSLGPLVQVMCPHGIGEDGPRRIGLFDASTRRTDPLRIEGSPGDIRIVEVDADQATLLAVADEGHSCALVTVHLTSNDGPPPVLTRLGWDLCEVATPDRVVSVEPYGRVLGLDLDEGWTPSNRSFPAWPACCSMAATAPPSPLLPFAGERLADGVYAIEPAHHGDDYETLTVDVFRWEACEVSPDRCMSDQENAAFVDRSDLRRLTLDLDRKLTVVVEGADAQVVGDGGSFRRLWRYAEVFCDARADGGGIVDGTFCEGPLGIRITSATDDFWEYPWWATLEIEDGRPVLWVWWGRIAG